MERTINRTQMHQRMKTDMKRAQKGPGAKSEGNERGTGPAPAWASPKIGESCSRLFHFLRRS